MYEMLWQGWELSMADEAGRASAQEESPKLPSGLEAWSSAAAAAIALAAEQAKPLSEREGLLFCKEERLCEFLCEKGGKLRTCHSGQTTRESAQEALFFGGGGDVTSHSMEELSFESRLSAMSRHRFAAVSDAEGDDLLCGKPFTSGRCPWSPNPRNGARLRA